MNIFRVLLIFLCTGLLFFSLPGIAWAQGKALSVPNLNSEYDELMPVIAPDGKTLYFVRTSHPENTGGEKAGQDIWFSQKIEDEWQPPENPGAPLNNIYNNAISSLSPDGKGNWLNNVYLARNRMAPGLSLATRTSAGWSKPEAITIQNFTPEGGFLNCFQANDSILFLSAQTDTTQMEDIFICRRVGEKEWSAPERIKKNINTTGFEIAPVLAPDGRTLYFTSNGHGGLGDADIFMSRRLDNTWLNWSEPVNLGAAVNTAGFDGYFTLDATSGLAYFTRENQEGNTDIYFIRLDDIKPTDNITAELPQAAEPLTETKGAAEISVSKPMLPMLVYFEVNSAELNAPAQKTIQNLVTQLKDSSGSVIIRGHADDTGTETKNKILSEKRAQAVANYLKLFYSPAAFIKIEGFGSSQPLMPNQSAENRARNRRVEIRIE
ncbi:hypothetical protein AAE02nite_29710 [Adhaeribacter aerolatus]|uniref:OmpA-like domain-containing protein n=2 Tax=Adhaeribacter aerolatus TaxID=670289 RepID=A0A512B0J1_9BACT|nr:hypothetical protein AAE02nite_29710 [Adhaeribacter aerolatus]